MVAHGVAEHVGGLPGGGGKEFGLVHIGVLGGVGDDLGVLRRDVAVGQRLGCAGQVSELSGEFHISLGAAP